MPRSAVLAGAKSAAMLVQGAWLIGIANIMWTGVFAGPMIRPYPGSRVNKKLEQLL